MTETRRMSFDSAKRIANRRSLGSGVWRTAPRELAQNWHSEAAHSVNSGHLQSTGKAFKFK